jgi:hypothetical protein
MGAIKVNRLTLTLTLTLNLTLTDPMNALLEAIGSQDTAFSTYSDPSFPLTLRLALLSHIHSFIYIYLYILYVYIHIYIYVPLTLTLTLTINSSAPLSDVTSGSVALADGNFLLPAKRMRVKSQKMKEYSESNDNEGEIVYMEGEGEER